MQSEVVCQFCGKTYMVRPSIKKNTKFCSKACHYSSKRLDVVIGYRQVQGVPEHRKIASNFIGWEMLINNVVHHINRNKSDNTPENIVVMSESQHQSLHKWQIKNGITLSGQEIVDKFIGSIWIGDLI